LARPFKRSFQKCQVPSAAEAFDDIAPIVLLRVNKNEKQHEL